MVANMQVHVGIIFQLRNSWVKHIADFYFGLKLSQAVHCRAVSDMPKNGHCTLDDSLLCNNPVTLLTLSVQTLYSLVCTEHHSLMGLLAWLHKVLFLFRQSDYRLIHETVFIPPDAWCKHPALPWQQVQCNFSTSPVVIVRSIVINHHQMTACPAASLCVHSSVLIPWPRWPAHPHSVSLPKQWWWLTGIYDREVK